MTTITPTKRRRTAKSPGRKNAQSARAVIFAPGSLEAELSAVGQSVPASEWAKVPADYFANLDRYLHRAPTKK